MHVFPSVLSSRFVFSQSISFKMKMYKYGCFGMGNLNKTNNDCVLLRVSLFAHIPWKEMFDSSCILHQIRR
jgi:hypothetical protein